MAEQCPHCGAEVKASAGGRYLDGTEWSTVIFACDRQRDINSFGELWTPSDRCRIAELETEIANAHACAYNLRPDRPDEMQPTLDDELGQVMELVKRQEGEIKRLAAIVETLSKLASLRAC